MEDVRVSAIQCAVRRVPADGRKYVLGMSALGHNNVGRNHDPFFIELGARNLAELEQPVEQGLITRRARPLPDASFPVDLDSANDLLLHYHERGAAQSVVRASSILACAGPYFCAWRLLGRLGGWAGGRFPGVSFAGGLLGSLGAGRLGGVSLCFGSNELLPLKPASRK